MVVIDIHEKRLAFAHGFGAKATFLAHDFRPEDLREVNHGRLADLAIVSTGAVDAIHMTWKCVDRGGTILVFAPLEPGIDLTLPLYDVWHDGITITTAYGGSPVDISQAIELIRSKTIVVNDMITHRFPLARAGEGFTLAEKAQDSLKVIIQP